MLRIAVLAAPLLVVLGCATTAAQQTSWGKAGVSMTDYRIDAGQCQVIALQGDSVVDSRGIAGGIAGQNQQAPVGGGAEAAVASGGGGASAGAATPLGGSVYRDTVPDDMVVRAANQVRAQELAQRRLVAQRLRSCLSSRGYREFRLTEEQRAHLATLPEASDERRAYLHRLGADSAVLEAQGL